MHQGPVSTPFFHQDEGVMAFFNRHIALRDAKLTTYECELIRLIQVMRY
jgi:hypothetical protein